MKKKAVTRAARGRKTGDTKRFWTLGVVLIVALVVILFMQYYTNRNTVVAQFNCDDGKSVKAVFHTGASGTVDLTLSDGRTMSLPVTASAGGARYANKGETVVFWNTGNTASLDENGKTTLKNCVTKQ